MKKVSLKTSSIDLIKALKHFEAARTNQDQLRKNIAIEKKNSRGDFQTKQLEEELQKKKANLDDADLFEEAKKRFGSS